MLECFLCLLLMSVNNNSTGTLNYQIVQSKFKERKKNHKRTRKFSELGSSPTGSFLWYAFVFKRGITPRNMSEPTHVNDMCISNQCWALRQVS